MVSIGRLAPDGQRFAEVIGARLPEALARGRGNAPIDVRNGSSAAAVYLGARCWSGTCAPIPTGSAGATLALAAGLRRRLGDADQGRRRQDPRRADRVSPSAGKPHERELELLGHAARLAALAIERCYAAEALRESEARFRGLYESVLEGVYQLSPDGKVVCRSIPACVKLLGYDSAEDIYALPGARRCTGIPAAHTEFVAAARALGQRARRRDAAAPPRRHAARGAR